ncbi:MAG: hypothetical protein QXP04_01855, partial [Candidatus Nanoarchaeia archaeon]|nr:hypothetical protein [Candidatus Jingweiarchaeum tengchongense]
MFEKILGKSKEEKKEETKEKEKLEKEKKEGGEEVSEKAEEKTEVKEVTTEKTEEKVVESGEIAEEKKVGKGETLGVEERLLKLEEEIKDIMVQINALKELNK